jgi:hypothetical protein
VVLVEFFKQWNKVFSQSFVEHVFLYVFIRF